MKGNGCGTHIVLKLKDIDKYLNECDKAKLSKICRTIADGREADGKEAEPGYFICNKDEPYADIVEKVIIDNENKIMEEEGY